MVDARFTMAVQKRVWWQKVAVQACGAAAASEVHSRGGRTAPSIQCACPRLSSIGDTQPGEFA
jgi:hypothetical protein